MIVRRTVLSALGGLVLGACGPAGRDGSVARFPKDSTMARIRERGVLTAGIKFDLPLFGYKDPSTGWITGFDADIARMVAQDLTGSEHNIRFIETMPRNREDFLDRGVADIVVATYSISDERRKLVDFTDPYYHSGQDVLVRSTDTDMHTVADLLGKTVCTGARSTPWSGCGPGFRRPGWWWWTTTASVCLPCLRGGSTRSAPTTRYCWG